MNNPRPRILAIDDTPANLMTLCSVLEHEFDLQFATSGPAGIDLAMDNPPDLILLDVMMPNVDGYETFRRLAAQSSLKHIPVVFVTALSDMNSEITGLALGAADYITKPINVTIARQRIRNLLEREHLHKEVALQRDQLAAEIQRRSLLEDQLRKLSVAVEQSPASVVITDLLANIEYVNPRFTEVTGYRADEVLGQNPRVLQSGLTDKETHRLMWGKLTGGQVWKGEFINRRKSGELYWEESQVAPIKNASGVITHYVALKTDISDRKLMEDQVHQLAFYDALTLLPNRRLLDDRLGQSLASCKRRQCFGALMFLDLDNFKPLNDLYGHGVGDLLLVEVAKRLLSCVRQSDTVARFGGDEFVLVLSELDGPRTQAVFFALDVAEKVRLALAQPYRLCLEVPDGVDTVLEHHCSSSVGVVVFACDDSHPDFTQHDLLKWADEAMYQAKVAGRNTVRLHQDHAGGAVAVQG